jgi:hypothetical protein
MIMTGRKILAVVFGVLGVLVGVALIVGAATVLAEDRDADGFYMSESYTFEAPTRAIVSEDIALLTDAPARLTDWMTDAAELRVRGASTSGESLFMGVGATADVEGYLGGMPYYEATSLDFDGSSITGVEYEIHAARGVPAAPGDQQIWVAWTDSAGPQTLEWQLESGTWTVVVMNSDASTGVAADLAVGARLDNLVILSWVAIAIGLIFLVGGGFLVYRGLRRTTEPEQVVDLREEGPPVEMPSKKELAGRS